jgi:hypothetical protein
MLAECLPWLFYVILGAFVKGLSARRIKDSRGARTLSVKSERRACMAACTIGTIDDVSANPMLSEHDTMQASGSKHCIYLRG